MKTLLTVGIPLLAILLIVLIIVFLKRSQGLKGILKAEEKAREIIARAEQEAEKIKRQAELETRERDAARQAEFEAQTKEKRYKLTEQERRLLHKEEALERRYQNLERKEKEFSAKERRLYAKEKELEQLEQKINETLEKQTRELERISGLTQEEAKNMLIRKIEDEAKLQAIQTVRRIEEETKEKSKTLAREIISNAIQRSAAEHVVETTVSVVDLPSDDMKGRIIGREGRNIRALEMATGVDIIIDDTPEAVILSSFDPLRRELARMAIEKLVADGRIHPARIEDIVEQVKVELEEKIKQEGENTLLELGIQNMHPELVKYLGKLKYRTSYGQNVLQHSKEVALLAALMARELGLDVTVALRAGLLHDIGKAVDKDYEGTHTELSVELTKKYGESEAVIQAIASHHRDIDFPSVEAVLVQAADTLSAARPGARRELLETYVQRLEKLEEIATSFEGVAKAFALQAGREIRIIVDAQKISDDRAAIIARDIAQKIKDELDYPGQIKVMVIREMRAVEYAR
ncbi:MAG TPA: ribonuclease Y [Candidatus Saccharicenans sp.]|jgi:ribonuclease Y|nr:ribonuclease Y [Candidatus Saccharicenans sp.]HPB59214.1 ribonuclease Y [Candidatus Saccharicenans sp.]HQO75744.1 ribonuclease Y [Candidatus Saccharicenans sp.]HUM79484.1 ribonuclease Y [Candidatus Saccharicenans sp.]